LVAFYLENPKTTVRAASRFARCGSVLLSPTHRKDPEKGIQL